MCTELGFFQPPRNKNEAMRSQTLKISYWTDMCSRVFGKDLPASKNALTNKIHGGLNIKGSNIIFANGSEDPWLFACMRELTDP
jgi:hypothetical protein